MVILSSEEFRAQENNRIQMGLERLINKINLQSTRGFGHMGNPSPTVEASLNNNEYIGYLMKKTLQFLKNGAYNLDVRAVLIKLGKRCQFIPLET